MSVFAAALVVGRTVSILFFALLSFLALKEYFSLISTRRVDRRLLPRLQSVAAALAEEAIVILFPEGTRGEPEVLSPLRSGVAHLLQRHPQLAAKPVFLHGLGKALPRGEALLVPFFCDVVVGEGLQWCGDRRGCLAELESGLTTMAAELDRPEWS